MEWQNLPAPCRPKVRPWSPPLIPPSETWHGETAGLMDGATRVSHDQLMNVSGISHVGRFRCVSDKIFVNFAPFDRLKVCRRRVVRARIVLRQVDSF